MPPRTHSIKVEIDDTLYEKLKQFCYYGEVAHLMRKAAKDFVKMKEQEAELNASGGGSRTKKTKPGDSR